jgi:hypothetical protein
MDESCLSGKPGQCCIGVATHGYGFAAHATDPAIVGEGRTERGAGRAGEGITREAAGLEIVAERLERGRHERYEALLRAFSNDAQQNDRAQLGARVAHADVIVDVLI